MTNNPIFIISGKQGEGKTTLLMQVTALLKKQQIALSGFAAKGYWKNGQRDAFDLTDLQSGKTIPLCTRNINNKHGFIFRMDALQYGSLLLKPSHSKNKILFVIDEVGKMELKGEVWFLALHDLLKKGNNPILITVRDQFVEQIVKKFGLTNSKIFQLPVLPKTVVKEILIVMNP